MITRRRTECHSVLAMHGKSYEMRLTFDHRATVLKVKREPEISAQKSQAHATVSDALSSR